MLKEAYISRQFYSEQPFPPGPYHLSMLISDHSFMYAIATPHFRSLVELCHVQLTNAAQTPDQLKDQVSFLVQNYFLHQKKFEKVHIALLNFDFNLLPEVFAAENNLKPFLKFTTGQVAIKQPATHLIKGMKFSYSINPELLNYLEKTFVNASIRHAGAVTLNLLFNQHSLGDCNVFMNINDSCFELAIKEKDNLLFYNVFNYSSNEDILYYLLFTMEQFNLNPLHVKISVACERPVTDELLKNLKKYIKQVSFCVHDPAITLKGELAHLPQHYYFTLFNQHTCEL